jgi:hypothetical protein
MLCYEPVSFSYSTDLLHVRDPKIRHETAKQVVMALWKNLQTIYGPTSNKNSNI